MWNEENMLTLDYFQKAMINSMGDHRGTINVLNS